MSAFADEARRAAAECRTEVAFRTWSLMGDGRRNRAALGGLRGRYSGRRCIVMGNGPSLLKADLNLVAADVTIVSNAHFLVWDSLVYTPTFLTVEDQLVAEDRAEELRRIDTTKLFAFDLRKTIGGPTAGETLYVNFPRRYPGVPKFSNDLEKRAYWGGTVSFLNLQLAAYLGCDPIVLIGFDHSYKVPAAELNGNVIHSTIADVNHIHPDYFGPGYRWHDPNVARMETAYLCARRELERRHIRVINATAGGHLEVFERAPFESLV